MLVKHHKYIKPNEKSKEFQRIFKNIQNEGVVGKSKQSSSQPSSEEAQAQKSLQTQILHMKKRLEKAKQKTKLIRSQTLEKQRQLCHEMKSMICY